MRANAKKLDTDSNILWLDTGEHAKQLDTSELDTYSNIFWLDTGEHAEQLDMGDHVSRTQLTTGTSRKVSSQNSGEEWTSDVEPASSIDDIRSSHTE